MNKQTWKIYYRLLRIINRESNKAMLDMMIYGTGYVKIDDNGIRHIPIQNIIIKDGKYYEK